MIPLHKVFVNKDLCLENLSSVFSSGFIGEGEEVRLFENTISQWIGKRFLALNSCTSSLHLALQLFKDPDTVVLTTPLTCVATNIAILHAGMHLRWVDVDLDNANISLDDLKNKLDSNTKIIVIVHLGGNSVDLNKLNEILDYAEVKYGFRPVVIEDCAQAIGAEFDNKLIGAHGNVCCFSFQSVKTLTTGDGGGLIVPADLENRAIKLRWFGIERKDDKISQSLQDIDEIGYKYHMNNIDAAIGLANFKGLGLNLFIQRGNGDTYNRELEGQKDVQLLNYIGKPSYSLYHLRVKNKKAFEDMLCSKGVEARLPHLRNDKHSIFKEYRIDLPNMNILETELTAIPSGWWVNAKQVYDITRHVKGGW
jgi:dTDP-4-amino-4,6-dideoxygalactose transaminase